MADNCIPDSAVATIEHVHGVECAEHGQGLAVEDHANANALL
jgi:hypothetical protein